jgi:hypothetical protein
MTQIRKTSFNGCNFDSIIRNNLIQIVKISCYLILFWTGINKEPYENVFQCVNGFGSSYNPLANNGLIFELYDLSTPSNSRFHFS